MKSHCWYIYIFWYTIILAVIYAWLLYKRDCKSLKMSKKEILNRRQFQAQLATPLILKRPSSTDVSPPAKRLSDHPLLDVHKDMIAHFPVKTKRGCCRHCKNGYTNTLCSKCNVHLCFSDEKNCLRDYHCK
ncbi:piggyBac transposable element-derived protein 3-like [Tachysurus ichikawai]